MDVMHMINNTTVHMNWSRYINDTINNKDSDPQALKWISLIILFGILSSNMLVATLLLLTQNKSGMKFFVANLAFADLCVGIFYVLPETLFNRFEVKWNPHVCYMYYAYFSMVPFYVSTYAIVVLSIDRAYVIVKPLAAASKGNTYRYGLALSSWITGCVLAIPYGVFGLYTEDNSCGHKFPNELMRRREKNGIMQHRHRDSEKDCGIDARDTSMSKAKIGSIKLMCVVVFAYLICWAPVTIAAILSHYDIVEPGLLYQILFLFAPLNSLSNPLVFLIFNTNMFLSKMHKIKTRVVSGTALEIQ